MLTVMLCNALINALLYITLERNIAPTYAMHTDTCFLLDQAILLRIWPSLLLTWYKGARPLSMSSFDKQKSLADAPSLN